MGQIIHLITRIQSIFGVLDVDGNVSESKPILPEVSRFDVRAFADAFTTIKVERDKIDKPQHGINNSRVPAQRSRKSKAAEVKNNA